MRTSDFIVKFVKKKGVIHETIKGWDYDKYQKLAALTKYIDYNCSFDKTGLCSFRKSFIKKKPTITQTMCCCDGCCCSIGYLKELPNEYDILADYAKCFDRKNGFWRPDKGCILPRRLRSGTCLTFACEKERWTSAERFLRRCLRRKQGSMVIDGYKCNYQYQVIDKLNELFEKEKGRKQS